LIVIDTDLLVDTLVGRAASLRFVEKLEGSGEGLATTILNVAELRRGAVQAAAARREGLSILLGSLEVLPLDDAAAGRYGALMAALDRAGRPIEPMDGLIAAIALENGGRLATRNQKHFERVAGLEILTP
jgi:predicted nucleic acid-binding protein